MRDKLCVMTKQKSQNLLLKVDPLSTIRNNKFITQGENFSGNRDSEGESFCIEYIVAAFKVWKIDMGFRIFFVIHVGRLHVFNKNLKVYLYM